MGSRRQPFRLEIACANVLQAKHRALSTLGSRHGLPRRLVRIKNIAELASGDVTDPAVSHQLQGSGSA